MIKNRTAQLIFQSVFCAFGLIGIMASVGFFNMQFEWEFYTYFTNISNYLCIAVMVAELISTAKKREDSYVDTWPVVKFIGVLGITLTCLVFNILLAGEPSRDPASNFMVGSVLLHIVMPIMYVVDWILFYEKKKMKWQYPFYAVLFPLVYAIYVYIHAWALGFDSTIMNSKGTGPLIYPYFFLNLDDLGVIGVLKWIGIIAVCFITMGYVYFGIDRLIGIKIAKKNK